MIGIISALGASISWTYACFIWRTHTYKYKSTEINLVKNIIAFIIFIPSFINLSSSIELTSFLTLLISGFIGIGLGDTFYINSLRIIGTRKTLSIETISPLLAALSGEIFINENLAIKSWIGIIIVSTSLFFLLIKKSNPKTKSPQINSEENNLKLYLFPFLSVLCAVIGGLLSRKVFLESNLSPFQTTEIRLLGGIFFLLTITKFRVNFFLKELKKNEQKSFLLSVVLGTNIGILLQQIVFKTLPIGIGWTLLSTSPVISLIFAKKEEGNITKTTIILTSTLFIGLSLIIL